MNGFVVVHWTCKGMSQGLMDSVEEIPDVGGRTCKTAEECISKQSGPKITTVHCVFSHPRLLRTSIISCMAYWFNEAAQAWQPSVWTTFVMAHNVTGRWEYVRLHGQFIDVARKPFSQEGWRQCCYFRIKTGLNNVARPSPEIKQKVLGLHQHLIWVVVVCKTWIFPSSPFLT